MALLLALARNVPQADASLKAGRWDRSKYSGVELYEKTLGILGFGRIGQLVAERARGFGMHVIAYDPVVSGERYKELGVERAGNPEDVYAVADFLSVHLPEDTGDRRLARRRRASPSARTGCASSMSPAARWSSMRTCRRRWTLARSPVRRWTCSSSEPITDHPLFGYPNVIVTPHLGASTAEATDRAGFQAAEQVVAALTGGPSPPRSTFRRSLTRTSRRSAPSCRCARSLGHDRRIARRGGASIDTVEFEFLGGIAARDTRLLGLNVLMGVLAAAPRRTSTRSTRPRLPSSAGSPSRTNIERRVTTPT